MGGCSKTIWTGLSVNLYSIVSTARKIPNTVKYGPEKTPYLDTFKQCSLGKVSCICIRKII